MEDHHLDRRTFLKVAGCGVFVLIPVEGLASLDAAQGGQRSYPDDINAYLKIGEDGRVTCYSGKVEMGQGNTTALAQMIAEELGVAADNVDMVMGDTRLCPWDGGTNGSRSIKYFGPALRAAGAEARDVLIQVAAALAPSVTPRGRGRLCRRPQQARHPAGVRCAREGQAHRTAAPGQAGVEDPGGLHDHGSAAAAGKRARQGHGQGGIRR
jgi:CO/xanthine dehydrogenase Mo-binding subunit